MTEIKFRVTFPCGLEIESYAKSIFLETKDTEVNACPLHKDKCSKKI